MTYYLHFEIKDLPKMANVASGKSHWRYAHQEATKWKDLVWGAVLEAGNSRPRKPLPKAILHLVRYSSVEPDYDGLVRGFKSVVDGLVKCGVLINDKLSTTGPWICEWKKVKPKQGKIEVRVYS